MTMPINPIAAVAGSRAMLAQNPVRVSGNQFGRDRSVAARVPPLAPGGASPGMLSDSFYTKVTTIPRGTVRSPLDYAPQAVGKQFTAFLHGIEVDHRLLARAGRTIR
jgi:hypothetical protein